VANGTRIFSLSCILDNILAPPYTLTHSNVSPSRIAAQVRNDIVRGFDPTAGAFAAVCYLRKSDEAARSAVPPVRPATYVAEPYLDGGADNDDMSVASTVTQSSTLPPDIGTASLPDRTVQWTWSVEGNGFDPTRALDVVNKWLWDRRRAQVLKYPQDRGEMVQKLATQGPHNAESIEMMLDQSPSDVDEVAEQLGNISIRNVVLGASHTDEDLEGFVFRPQRPSARHV
jgi:hypothetical protein